MTNVCLTYQTKRRNACWLLIGLLAGCAPSTTAPPAGAPTAEAAAPPIGASWKIRTTNELNNSSQDITLTAVAVTYNGKPAYGVSNGTVVRVFTLDTFNQMATLREGKEEEVMSPDSGGSSWPFWLGKTWTATSSYSDVVRGRTFNGVKYNYTISSFENVTVPAGTFQAYRIDYSPSIPGGSFGSRWYAPSTKTTVRSTNERGAGHYLGAGKTLTELLTVPK